MGCIGMSLEDFCQCTPSEFQSIYDEWSKYNEGLMRRSWEQTRFIALTNLTPFSKKALKNKDIMVFPWEKKENKAIVPGGTSSYERFKEIERRVRECEKKK